MMFFAVFGAAWLIFLAFIAALNLVYWVEKVNEACRDACEAKAAASAAQHTATRAMDCIDTHIAINRSCGLTKTGKEEG
jgi:hypothetical protein